MRFLKDICPKVNVIVRFEFELAYCDNTPYINFFETILSWPVNHLVVSAGAFHISLWPQEIQPREQEKGNKEQTNNKGLGKLKVQEREFCNIAFLCICRLTLACISSEISTKLLGMPTHPDWPSLTASFC